MRLAPAPLQYDRGDQARMREQVAREDGRNIKRDVAVDYVLLKQADGTVGKLTVDDTGTLIWTAL